jgi:hypothetical protein
MQHKYKKKTNKHTNKKKDNLTEDQNKKKSVNLYLEILPLNPVDRQLI